MNDASFVEHFVEWPRIGHHRDGLGTGMLRQAAAAADHLAQGIRVLVDDVEQGERDVELRFLERGLRDLIHAIDARRLPEHLVQIARAIQSAAR